MDYFNTPLYYILALFLFYGWTGCLCYVTLVRRTTLARYHFISVHQRELTCQCKILYPLPSYCELPDSVELPTYEEANVSCLHVGLPQQL